MVRHVANWFSALAKRRRDAKRHRTTFIGFDGDWNNAANWTNGVPDNNSIVTIVGNADIPEDVGPLYQLNMMPRSRVRFPISNPMVSVNEE